MCLQENSPNWFTQAQTLWLAKSAEKRFPSSTNSDYGWLIATLLAKYLAAVIDPVLQLYSNNCIKDSFTFAKEMQDLQMHPKETFLCSFDICSLFTTVPLAETIQICADSLYGGELIRPDYPKEIFLKQINS